jgi:hypothetical protein
MIDVESCRRYAADCLRLAEGEDAPEDRNILLNVALAWVRLGQQTQAYAGGEPAAEAAAADPAPDEAPAREPETAH